MKKIILLCAGLFCVHALIATDYYAFGTEGRLAGLLEENKSKDQKMISVLYYLYRGINLKQKPESLTTDKQVQALIKQYQPLVTKVDITALATKENINAYLTCIEKNASIIDDLDFYVKPKTTHRNQPEDLVFFGTIKQVLYDLIDELSVKDLHEKQFMYNALINKLFKAASAMFPKLFYGTFLTKLSHIEDQKAQDFWWTLYNNNLSDSTYKITKKELIDLESGELQEEVITQPFNFEPVNKLGLGLHKVRTK